MAAWAQSIKRIMPIPVSYTHLVHPSSALQHPHGGFQCDSDSNRLPGISADSAVWSSFDGICEFSVSGEDFRQVSNKGRLGLLAINQKD